MEDSNKNKTVIAVMKRYRKIDCLIFYEKYGHDLLEKSVVEGFMKNYPYFQPIKNNKSS